MGWLNDLENQWLTALGGWTFHPTIAHHVRLFFDPHSLYLCFFIIGLVVLRERKTEGLKIAALMIFALLLTNLLSSEVLKPLLGRPRPCALHVSPHFSTACGNLSPSFPSSHSANSMAIAIVAQQFNSFYGLALIIGSILTGLSRVYLGLHFPTDVLGGWIVGYFCSIVSLKISKKLYGQLAKSTSNVK